MNKKSTTPVLQKMKTISKLPYGGHSKAFTPDPDPPKIRRAPAVYSNTSPYGIASDLHNKKQIV